MVDDNKSSRKDKSRLFTTYLPTLESDLDPPPLGLLDSVLSKESQRRPTNTKVSALDAYEQLQKQFGLSRQSPSIIDQSGTSTETPFYFIKIYEVIKSLNASLDMTKKQKQQLILKFYKLRGHIDKAYPEPSMRLNQWINSGFEMRIEYFRWITDSYKDLVLG